MFKGFIAAVMSLLNGRRSSSTNVIFNNCNFQIGKVGGQPSDRGEEKQVHKVRQLNR